MMDEARLAKLKHRATQAIESARGDGFAEVVLELVAYIEGLEQVAEQAVELAGLVNQLAESETEVENAPPITPPPPPDQTEDLTASAPQEMEALAELEPTSKPRRKRKVAEAGGDLSGSD